MTRLNRFAFLQLTRIIILICVVTGWSANAQQQSTAGPKTTSTFEKPENKSGFDEAELFWKSKRKYFLVVAATKTGGTGNNLPFTKVDGQRISKTLVERGYEKLEVLDDKRATHDNFIKQLKRIRSFPENALVLVYYSGHAVKDPQEKDLWLQLYGQTEFGDHFGVSLSELIGSARGNTYKGDLVIVLDTCYSGQSTLSGQLSLRETEKTVIFASSTAYQESYSMKLPSGEISAFTYYLLEGLGSDWAQVDGDADGIVFYNDLQTYIENKLLESRQNEAILGTMQPQLFGQSSKIWAAYDPNKVHNRDTQARRNLRLERTFQLQDPDKLTDLLRGSFPPDAHAYLKALKAIDDKKLDEASELLVAAEKEGRVPLAEIYWARANLKTEQGQLASARDWYEKALAISPQRNIDLIGYAAGTNFALGNWIRASELFKQVLELSSDRNTEPVFGALFSLAMLNVLQGNTVEADLFLRQLKEIDPKVLGDDEEGVRVLVPFIEMLSDLIKEKPERARDKMDELQKAIAASDPETRASFQSFLQMVNPLLNATETDPEPLVLSATQMQQWTEALKAKNMNTLVLLLNQLQALALIPSAADSLRSPEVERLLKQTVDFAHEYKSQKQSVEIHDSSGVIRKLPIDGSEKQSSVESATLLTVAAMFYLARQESAEAEKLFKEAIALDGQEENGTVLALNPVMRLAELYQESGRMTEAETLFKNLLMDLHEPLGDQNVFAYLINQRLGALYDDWKRFTESERSYRTSLRMAISAFGSESFMAIDARETLATFLTEQNRLADAIQLLEETVSLLDQKTASGSLMNADSLGKDYFALAQDYYNFGRYEAAEKTLRRVSDIYSSKKKPDLIENLSCLHWQWVTALALKKEDDANSFYGRMLQTVESNVANPKPNETLGAELQSLASWFRNANEYSKADQLLRLAMLVQEKRYGPDKLEVAQVHQSLADLYEAERQYENAITSLKKAEQIYVNQKPQDQVRIAFVIYRKGFDFYQLQDFDQAHQFLQRASDLVDQMPANLRTDFFSKYQFPKYLLGRVERISGHYETANTLINAVLDIDEVVQPRQESYIASDQLELSAISRLQGNSAEAERWLARAENALNKLDVKEATARLAKLAHEKGMLELHNRQDKKALALLREAVEKGQTDPEMDQVSLAEFLDDYAKVLRQTGKDKEANQIEQRAKRIRDLLRNGK